MSNVNLINSNQQASHFIKHATRLREVLFYHCSKGGHIITFSV